LLPKSAKSREILWKFELKLFKVIQGRRSWYQSKARTQLPISNCGRISYSFRDIDAFSFKIACFPPPHRCLMPRSGRTLCNINIIYTRTSLKRTFSGLQFCQRHYGSIFIRLAVVAFQNRNHATFWKKFDLIYSNSRSSKVIDLGVNRKPRCDFYESLIVTLDVSPTVFEILTFKPTKWLVFPTPHLFDSPVREELLRHSGWNLSRKN